MVSKIVRAVLLLISLLAVSSGIAITSLLSWASLAKVPLPCSEAFQCETVLSSSWSHVVGIPISLVGLMAFSTLAGLLFFAIWRQSEQILRLAALLAGISVTVSIILTAYAHFGLHSHCVWCLASGLCFAVSTVSLVVSQSAGRFPWARGGETLCLGLVIMAVGISSVYWRLVLREADGPACNPILASRIGQEQLFSPGAISWAPKDPSLTVVIFADLECEACHSLFIPLLKSVQSRNGRLILRHYPVGWHQQAFNGATALLALGVAGKAEALRIFSKPVDTGDLQVLIDRVKRSVSGDTWSECVNGVKRDISLGSSIGLKSTPCVLIIADGMVTAVPAASALQELAALRPS